LRQKKSRDEVFAEKLWKKDEKNFFPFPLNSNDLAISENKKTNWLAKMRKSVIMKV
jgi:hypothetical protein